jgi:Spy/CpxP family protein refolding chaperone
MGGPWSFGPRIAQELNLSQDQIATLKALHADFVEATKATREQLRDKMSELAALWADDQSTAADIKAKAEEIEALRSIIRNTGIDYLVRARNVLTPEQRTKLSELIKNRPGFGGGMGMMMGCQGPGMGGECPVGGPGMGGGMGRRGGK